MINFDAVDKATTEFLRSCATAGLNVLDRVFIFAGRIYMEIPDFPKYWINTDGVVIGPSGNPLKLNEHITGYYKVHLRDKKCFVHRLVISTFDPNPIGDNLIVNHKDSDKKNNHIDNLEWITPAEGLLHFRSEDYKKELIKKVQSQLGNDATKEDFITLLLKEI